MVDNNKKFGEWCIDKVTKNETNQSHSVNKFNVFGDNVTLRKTSHLIDIEKNHNKKLKLNCFDGENYKTTEFNHQTQYQLTDEEVTVNGANHNSPNANSAIDSRACYKPEKKVTYILRMS